LLAQQEELIRSRAAGWQLYDDIVLVPHIHDIEDNLGIQEME